MSDFIQFYFILYVIWAFGAFCLDLPTLNLFLIYFSSVVHLLQFKKKIIFSILDRTNFRL